MGREAMSDMFVEPDDATPLSPEDKRGLIPSYISTRAELNREEQRNILEAVIWAGEKQRDILSVDALKNLHKRMFGKVWEWAGQFSQVHDRPIGVQPFMIEPDLRQLVDDVKYWIDHQSYSADEIAVRFHHRLVFIHPFPNGNGRMSRQAADMLIQSLGGEKLPWGRGDLRSANETRRAYIDALRQADQHDFTALILFARSGEK
jgi:Fic-DOC domain mobile mystery protein B